MQVVLREKVKCTRGEKNVKGDNEGSRKIKGAASAEGESCVRGQIKCKGENKGFLGEGGGMTSTNAEDENEKLFKGEIRGADSTEGRYEKQEGKM